MVRERKPKPTPEEIGEKPKQDSGQTVSEALEEVLVNAVNETEIQESVLTKGEVPAEEGSKDGWPGNGLGEALRAAQEKERSEKLPSDFNDTLQGLVELHKEAQTKKSTKKTLDRKLATIQAMLDGQNPGGVRTRCYLGWSDVHLQELSRQFDSAVSETDNQEHASDENGIPPKFAEQKVKSQPDVEKSAEEQSRTSETPSKTESAEEEKSPVNFQDKLHELNELCRQRNDSEVAMNMYTDMQKMYDSMASEKKGDKPRYRYKDFEKGVSELKKELAQWKRKDFQILLTQHHEAAREIYEEEKTKEVEQTEPQEDAEGETEHEPADYTERLQELNALWSDLDKTDEYKEVLMDYKYWSNGLSDDRRSQEFPAWSDADFANLVVEHEKMIAEVEGEYSTEEVVELKEPNQPQDEHAEQSQGVVEPAVGDVSSETDGEEVDSVADGHGEVVPPTKSDTAPPSPDDSTKDGDDKSGYREEMLHNLFSEVSETGEIVREASDEEKQKVQEQAAEIILKTNPELQKIAEEDNEHFEELVRGIAKELCGDSMYADEVQEIEVDGHKVHLDDQLYVAALGQIRQRELAAQAYAEQTWLQSWKKLRDRLSDKDLEGTVEEEVKKDYTKREKKLAKKGKTADHYDTTSEMQRMQHELLTAETADAWVAMAKEDALAHSLDTVLDERMRFEEARHQETQKSRSEFTKTSVNFLRKNKRGMRFGGVAVAAGAGLAIGGLALGAVAAGRRVAGMSAGIGTKKLFDWMDNKWMNNKEEERIRQEAEENIATLIHNLQTYEQHITKEKASGNNVAEKIARDSYQRTREMLTETFVSVQHSLSIEDAKRLKREIKKTLAASVLAIGAGMGTGEALEHMVPEAPEVPVPMQTPSESPEPLIIPSEEPMVSPEVEPITSPAVDVPPQDAAAPTTPSPESVPSDKKPPIAEAGVVAPVAEELDVAVQVETTTELIGEGKTVWAQAEHVLEQGALDKLIQSAKIEGVQNFGDLSEAQQTYLIDWLKDEVVAHPENFNLKEGIDVEHAFPKDTQLDFTKVVQEQGGEMFAKMKGLTLDQVANIQHNVDIATQAAQAGIPSATENLEHMLGNNIMEEWIENGEGVTPEHFNNYTTFVESHPDFTVTKETLPTILEGNGESFIDSTMEEVSLRQSLTKEIDTTSITPTQLKGRVAEVMNPKGFKENVLTGRFGMFKDGQWDNDWDFYKGKHALDLVRDRITDQLGDSDALESVHKDHLKEWISPWIEKGKIDPHTFDEHGMIKDLKTIDQVVKEIMVLENKQ